MNKMMLKKQYLMHNPKKSGLPSRLPSDFQEVEYIESTGTQYIDTGLTPNGNYSFDIKINASTNRKSILGALEGWEKNAISLYINDYINLLWSFANKSKQATHNSFPLNTDIQITSNRGTLRAGNEVVILDNSSFNYTGRNIILFGTNGPLGPVEFALMKLYYCKWYDGNTLIRNLIPCYRKSDNEVGLYDIVNNQFYTNSGSGSFLKGKDVIYTPTNAVSFASDSWETIQAEAERISNFYEKYGFIPFNTPYGIYNPEHNDTNNIRKIIYNNEEIQIAIIGMCHDTLQTSYSGGGTKAGITWQTTKSLFKSAVDSSSASGGWSSCSLRTSLNSTHFNLLPQEMQNAIKVVAKKSNNGSGSITTSNDKLFTLSMVEIMGTTKRNSSTNLAIDGEGTQYEYYKNAPLIKDSNNITWTGLSGTKGTCIANGNSYITLIDGVQTPDANDYINYRNAKVYKPNGNASYYGTRSFKEANNECMYVWRAGNITYTTASNSDLEVCFAGCI